MIDGAASVSDRLVRPPEDAGTMHNLPPWVDSVRSESERLKRLRRFLVQPGKRSGFLVGNCNFEQMAAIGTPSAAG